MQDIMTLHAALEKLQAQGFSQETVGVESIRPSLGKDGIVLETPTQVVSASGKETMAQLKRFLGINSCAIKEYSEDPELVSKMFSYGLKRKAGQKIKLVTRGHRLASLIGSDDPWLSPVEIFETVVGSAPKDAFLGLESIRSPDETKTQLRFVTHQSATPPKKLNDISHGGIWISSNGVLETGSYVYRMACSNGMLANRDAVAERTVDAARETLGASVRKALELSSKLLKDFVHLDEHEEPNPAVVLNLLAGEYRLSTRRLRMLLDAIPALPSPVSRYDLVNLVTSQAHLESHEDDFEWFGSAVVDHYGKNVCSHCHQDL